ncbi:MAG: BMP family ABC transporter substrate-binding protein [Peptococcaceae bacterium]|nr:BMP family ABC transporter substrate-binding protein [Peptococcaceae bacterium]
MKRVLTILLSITLVFALAVGCSQAPDQGQGQQSAQEKMKIGFVYIGSATDAGYTYAHDQGRLMLEQELGDRVETIIKENVPETQECEKVMTDMIDQGCKVIFANSFGFQEYVKRVAEANPDIIFLHCSGSIQGPNYSNYFGSIEEARYLSGIVAGMKTQTNKIGYVAAYNIPEVIRGINAFTLGVRSVNPEAVVKVMWTNTWFDPAKEKDAAIALLDQGVDVIAQHQDTTGPQVAAEERGCWSIGYNADMSNAAPKAYMTAPLWNWGAYYVEVVKSILDGTWTNEPYWGTMKDGLIDLAPLTEVAPEGAQEAVTEIQEQMKAGTFDVFAGPIKDQSGKVVVPEGSTVSLEEQLAMKWFVEGVEGKIE